MKSILLPFQDDDIAESALGTAHLVASRHHGHIEGLFVLAEPQIIGAGLAGPDVFITQIAEDARKMADAARGRFDAYLERTGLRRAEIDDMHKEATASWNEVDGLTGQIIGERSRLFDLVVVGRATNYYAGDWNTTCETALFDSGRPVLVAPDKVGETIAENVVIAWNCSTESARTVALGMSLIADSRQITILSTPGASVPGPDGRELAAHLRRHGLTVAHESLGTVGGEETGAGILEYAETHGVDLILKGAYTHTRLRQIIFGGATRHILTNARIPVLMAH